MDDGRTLLVVGDDARTRSVCEYLAERRGYAVATASDGDPSAWEEESTRERGPIRETEAPPDAALVSAAAGAAGVRAVRERRPDIPTVALHDDADRAAAALAAGATHAVRLASREPSPSEGDSDGDVPSRSAESRRSEKPAEAEGTTRAAEAERETAEAAREAAAVFDRAIGAGGSETRAGVEVRSPNEGDGSRATESETVVELLAEAVDQLSEILYIYEAEGTMLWWNDRFAAVTGYDDAAIAGMEPTAFVAPPDREPIADAIERVVATGSTQATADLLTADGERIPYELTGTRLETDGARTVIAGTGRDISERRRRERALERQTDRLATLNHINAVIREVNEALVRTETREEIEAAVCERLAGAEPYRFVWIGEFDRSGEGVVPRAQAGEGGAYLAERADAPSEWATAAAAMRDDEVKVVERMTADEEQAPWHEEAVEHGHHSAAGIPIAYRGRTYGVLCVYAPRPGAFDERERTVLRELGETVGYAISAAERRHALLSDAVTEVELSVAAPGPTFVNASAAVDDAVRLDGVVETDEGIAEFLRVPTDRAADLRRHAADAGVDLCVVTEHDEESVVRVRVGDRSLAAMVADHGGTLAAGTADAGRGTATVELPTGASVRDLVDRIDDAYEGDVSLRAQREGEPGAVTGLRFREALDEALTARQREVVETAHHAGFFEWPRDATAGEVADLLGIAAPTFHEHLRHVQRKLVAAYLHGDQSHTS